MARYVLLRIEDDDQADDLLRDIALNPRTPLLTPLFENEVLAEVVPDLDPSDFLPDRSYLGLLSDTHPSRARGLRAVLRQSYARSACLASEWEASL